MNLKSIKLAGFKSFVDPTTIPFRSNLTGIVGPNGCGKSNVIDAVRWVMGESSAKQLRGESIADVVFAGTNTRKQVGQASVELVFDNTITPLSGEYASYAEISIKRVVTRDGTSTYYLNGSKCRRKDIVNIFLGTGLGPRSYAIIEQGTVSRLVEAKPLEMRQFLEETAGISKYRERKRETENRIKHTRENLQRIIDIKEELENQLAKLEKQVKIANRFKDYKLREKTLKLQLAAIQLDGLQAQRSKFEEELNQLSIELEALRAEKGKIDKELVEHREGTYEISHTLDKLLAKQSDIATDIVRLEETKQYKAHRKTEVEQQLSSAKDELNEFETEVASADVKSAHLGRDIETSETNLVELKESLDAVRARLSAAQAEYKTAQSEWESHIQASASAQNSINLIQAKEQSLTARLSQAEQSIQALESEGGESNEEEFNREKAELETELSKENTTRSGIKAAITQLEAERDETTTSLKATEEAIAEHSQALNGQQSQLTALKAKQDLALAIGKQEDTPASLSGFSKLAQNIQVRDGWNLAAEVALENYMQAFTVDTIADMRDGLPLEKDFILVDKARGSTPEAPHGSVLSDFIQTDYGSVYQLTDYIYTADNFDQAWQLLSKISAPYSVITKDGIWLGPGRIFASRSKVEENSVLERGEEIKQLSQEIDTASTSLDALKAEQTGLESKLEGIQATLKDNYIQNNDAKTRIAAIDTKLNMLIRNQKENEAQALRIQKLLSENRQTKADTEAELKAIHDEHQTLSENLAALNEKTSSLEANKAGIEEKLELIKHDNEACNQDVQEVTIDLGAKRSELSAIKENLNRLFGLIKKYEEKIAELEEEQDRLNLPDDDLDANLERKLFEKAGIDKNVVALRDKKEEKSFLTNDLEQAKDKVVTSIEKTNESITTLCIKKEEFIVRSEGLIEEIQAQELSAQDILQEVPEGTTVDDIQEDLTKLGGKVERLGAINLAAVEEYDTEKERMEYLNTQYNDLEDSLSILEKAIDKIDNETKTRFKETFDEVNMHIKSLFPALFGGGAAYLEYSEPHNLLETGVIVNAKPPGKKNSKLTSLSGGEKALTAIALVFSFFQLNPSPFCILDEVDAPLDDANVGRFCNLLRKMSDQVQFIFITHNKVTMELADQLTGVTMNEPGISRMVSVDVKDLASIAD